MTLRRTATLALALGGLAACTDERYYIHADDRPWVDQSGLVRKSGGYPGVIKDEGGSESAAMKHGSTVVLWNYLVQTGASVTGSTQLGDTVTTTTLSFDLGEGAEVTAPFLALLTDGFKRFDVKLATKGDFASSEAATTLAQYNKTLELTMYDDLAGNGPYFVPGKYARFVPAIAKDLGADYFLIAQLNFDIFEHDPDKLISITDGVPVLLNVQVFDAAGRRLFSTEKRAWHATPRPTGAPPVTKEAISDALWQGSADVWKQALQELDAKLQLAKR